eukprot:m.447304 g.447304  ORF g.447304 m.447304 type:complete len:67 (-) comp21501_c1_seq7:453-653(-)
MAHGTLVNGRKDKCDGFSPQRSFLQWCCTISTHGNRVSNSGDRDWHHQCSSVYTQRTLLACASLPR